MGTPDASHQTATGDEAPSDVTHEKYESLWWLAVSPTIWALHLLAMYITVAIFCAKTHSATQPLEPVWWLMVLFTLAAIAGIVATGLRGYRRHRYGSATVPHDFDTPEDRHRFIGFAVLLMSGLSLVAVLFVTLPALFIGTCQ